MFGDLLGEFRRQQEKLFAQVPLPAGGGDKAVSIINVDSPVPADALEQIRAIEQIVTVRTVTI